MDVELSLSGGDSDLGREFELQSVTVFDGHLRSQSEGVLVDCTIDVAGWRRLEAFNFREFGHFSSNIETRVDLTDAVGVKRLHSNESSRLFAPRIGHTGNDDGLL